MVDAHKVGIQIRFNIGTGIENFEPKENLIGQFEGTIRDIPESVIMTMQGLVIVKLPQDPPETSEPLVYAYAKLDSARNMKIRSAEALQLAGIAEKLSNIVELQGIEQEKEKKAQSKADQRIKAISLYRNLASKVFSSLGLSADDEIDLEQCCQLLDLAEVFLIKAQTKRLFDA
eukprot:gene19484-19911_t